MSLQTLTIRPNTPIVIETPVGYIEIERADRRKLKITLPEVLTAHLGKNRAEKNAKYVNSDGSPKFNLLKPIMDDEGRIVDVEQPVIHHVDVGTIRRTS